MSKVKEFKTKQQATAEEQRKSVQDMIMEGYDNPDKLMLAIVYDTQSDTYSLASSFDFVSNHLIVNGLLREAEMALMLKLIGVEV